MNNMNNYKTLYNYIKSEYKNSGKKLSTQHRNLIYNLGLIHDSITVDRFCKEFNLETDINSIMDFITDLDNSYTLARFANNSKSYVHKTLSLRGRTSRQMQNHPEEYGL